MITFKFISGLDLNFSLYCRVIKILCNKAFFHKRSSLRNIWFDFIRCDSVAILNAVIFLARHGLAASLEENSANLNKLLFNFVLVCVLSIAINYLLDAPVQFEKNRFLWSVMMIEFVSCFGSGGLDFMNYFERGLGGNLLWCLYEAELEWHSCLVGYWIEDMIYGDLKQSYG